MELASFVDGRSLSMRQNQLWCRAGSTLIAVAKSGAEGGGSEQCLRNRLRGLKRGLVRRAKTSRRAPGDLAGPALVANSLRRGQEKRTMHEARGELCRTRSCRGERPDA